MPQVHEYIVNQAINNFATQDKPSLLQWNHLKVISQVQQGLLTYEAHGRNLSFEQLMDEQHDASRLARHMEANGDPRPHPLCHCHAIIAGKDPRSITTRGVMAWMKMRIDFPLNGAWLPRNTAAKTQMPGKLKNAVPHSRIHRNGYYRWLDTQINFATIKDEKSLADTLKTIRFKLETSTFPSDIMLRADQLP